MAQGLGGALPGRNLRPLQSAPWIGTARIAVGGAVLKQVFQILNSIFQDWTERFTQCFAGKVRLGLKLALPGMLQAPDFRNSFSNWRTQFQIYVLEMSSRKTVVLSYSEHKKAQEKAQNFKLEKKHKNFRKVAQFRAQESTRKSTKLQTRKKAQEFPKSSTIPSAKKHKKKHKTSN